jgi:hypothetical protein
MKKNILILAALVLAVACQKKKEESADSKPKYASFGSKITPDQAITKDALLAQYGTLKEGDTVPVKFTSTINDVCQKKGCWMNVALSNNEETFVKFKDYGFFMPLNSKGSEVVVNGKAFLSIVSVDELKHYAKDAGKSKASIDSITQPEKSFGFIADGVLIKE